MTETESHTWETRLMEIITRRVGCAQNDGLRRPSQGRPRRCDPPDRGVRELSRDSDQTGGAAEQRRTPAELLLRGQVSGRGPALARLTAFASSIVRGMIGALVTLLL